MIRVDEDGIEFPRFSFSDKDGSQTTLNRTITVDRVADKCENYLEHEIFINSEIRDKLNPVNVNLTWSLVEDENVDKRTRREGDSTPLTPILDIQNRQGLQLPSG